MGLSTTYLNFQLACTAAEAERLIAAFRLTGEEAALPGVLEPVFASGDPDDPFANLVPVFQGTDFAIGAEIARNPAGVRISAAGEPLTVAICELIRRLAPSSLPAGFTWCDTYSSPEGDGVGGGYALIRTDGYSFVHLVDLLDQAMEAARV